VIEARTPGQREVDERNAAFWAELCGTTLARSAGVSENDPQALQRFDSLYFEMYPYLKGYVDRRAVAGADVLEIGLGYGTLGSYLVQRGARYRGLDIAATPVEMMRHRLRLAGVAGSDDAVVEGSALAIPWPEASFDLVYSIGCLHHTGDLRRSVDELRRVLRPGGCAVVMLYYRHSVRRLLHVAAPDAFARIGRRRRVSAVRTRAMYDANQAGDAAPHTDFVSRRDVSRLFGEFASVRARLRNFDSVQVRGHVLVPRSWLLRTPLPRLAGLDLYVEACR
jgi:SAM-dependent methyltransferase